MKASLKHFFSPRPPTEAEQALTKWGIRYKKQRDGMLVVTGDMDVSNKGLTSLPDLSKVIVTRSFFCGSNRLTSLRGAPASVGIDFWCDGNQLASLQGVPASIPLNFVCNGNHLTSLEGGPTSVGQDYKCNDNRLASLRGAPASLGWDFWCKNNPIASLEYAPQTFKKLASDLGEFSSPDDVPENLRLSPETRARQAREREAREQERIFQFTEGAVVLQQGLKIRGVLRLKKRAAMPG